MPDNHVSLLAAKGVGSDPSVPLKTMTQLSQGGHNGEKEGDEKDGSQKKGG